MNRKQWFVLGIGLFILSTYLWSSAFSWQKVCINIMSTPGLYTACVIKAQSYGIPAIISLFLGWIVIICGFLEPKKKMMKGGLWILNKH